MQDKILNFIQKYLKYQDRELMRDYLVKHEKYGTSDVIVCDGDVVAVSRWNISDDGKTAYVLDLAIREDWRGKGLFRDILERRMKQFNKIEKIVFKRGVRGDERMRTLSIEDILRHEKF